ncbi:MAG TPA: TonB-dependent receptor, partial [Pyrinomonadaceae bacterium]
IRGRHTLRTGIELHYYTRGADSPGWSNGTFGFGTSWTQQFPDVQQNQSDGSGVASLLLGTPTSGQIDWNASSYRTRPYYGFYVQDDWKVSPRLTLNLGMRYDVQVPWIERFNRVTRGFDVSTKNPLSDQILANWAKVKADFDAKNPTAKYPYPAPPSVLLGGYLFPGVGGQPRRQYDTDWTNIAPRAGVAWRVAEKTVIRAGAGVYYNTPTQTGVVAGFSQTTPYTTSLDGLTPSAGLTGPYSLVNPFPNGLAAPAGSSLGLLTNIGNSLSFDPPHYKLPRTYQYSFGFERELPHAILVEVSFAGNYQTYIELGYNQNRWSFDDNAKGFADNSYLNRTLPNPFFGILPITSGLGASATISAQNLLRPDPIFSDVTNNLIQAGHYRSDALQVKIEKRLLGSGNTGVLLFGLSYTFAKAYEQNHRLNNWNTLETPIYELDNTDKTHNLAFHGVWDLPFGKNRPLSISNAVANTIAGDWRFDWILSYVSGYPVGWPNLNNTCGDWGASANNGVQSEDRWFNNDKGQTLPDGTKRPNCYANFPSFFVRTIPDRFPDIREPQKPQLNVALEKTFHISERYKFQFRGEAFNVTNTSIRTGPDTGFTSPTFGQLPKSQKNFPRVIQLAMKIYF